MQGVFRKTERFTPLLWIAVAVLAVLAGLKTFAPEPFSTSAAGEKYCLPVLMVEGSSPCAPLDTGPR